MECKTSLKVRFVWLSYITKITFLIRVLEENVIQIFQREIFLGFICLDSLNVLNLYGYS